VHENVQVVESLQGNDGLRNEEGIKGLRVAHPSRDQCFGHRRGQDPVVLDPVEGLGPIGGDSLANQRMKRVMDNQRLGLVMGSMECLRSRPPGTSSPT